MINYLKISFIALLFAVPAEAARFASGVVYPSSLSATNTWVDVGYTNDTYGVGSIRIDGGSHWHVGPSRFNIQSDSSFTAHGAGTSVEVAIDQGVLWLIDGTVNVESGASLYSRLGYYVGDSNSETNNIGYFNVSAASASGSGITLYHGHVLVENGGSLTSPISSYSSPEFTKNNSVTVRGNNSVITRDISLYGGQLLIEDGGCVSAGGELQGYYADDPTRITRATVTGSDSCWGGTNFVSHTIYEGGECTVKHGGSITSQMIRVGMPASTNFIHTAKLTVTGATSRVVSRGGEGCVQIGENSPGRVDVLAGALLDAHSVTVYSNGSLFVANNGSIVTCKTSCTVFGDFSLTDNARFGATGLYINQWGSALLNNAEVQGRDFNQYGGTVDASDSTLTVETARLGQTHDCESGWNAATFIASNCIYLGHNASATFAADNGTIIHSKNVVMGFYSSGNGIFGLTNTQLQVDDALVVGDAGRATLFACSNSVITAQICRAATDAGSSGTIDLQNAQLSCNELNVASNGTAKLRISEGAAVRSPLFTIAQGHGTGTVLIAGSGSSLHTTNKVYWGSAQGSASLTLTNGAQLTTHWSKLQETTNSEAAASLYGTGTQWNVEQSLEVSAADLTVNNGANLRTGDLNVYEIWSKPGSGRLKVNGGHVHCTNTLSSAAQFFLTDGAFLEAKESQFTLNTTASTAVVEGAGTILTNSGMLSVATSEESRALHISEGAKVYAQQVYVGSPWGWSGGDISLSGSNTLLQMSGVCQVGFDDSEEGGDEEERATRGNRSNAFITNCLSLAGSEVKASQLSILNSGLLRGEGILRGMVVNGGQVDPGSTSTAGTLTCSSGYQQTTNGILHVDLLGVPALNSYDVLQSSGDVTMNGILQVNITGWTPAGEHDFQIISAKGSISGSFDRIDVQGLNSNQVSYLGNGVLRVSGPSSPSSGWLRMYGTNDALLVNGAEPSTSNGTDFGPQIKTIAVTNIFGALNASNSTLTVSSWTEHDPDGVFEVVSAPNTIAYPTESNVVIRFKPLTGGVYSAYIEVASTSPDSPFILKLAGSAKEDQLIQFQNPGDQLTTNTVLLNASASSGLPVSFSVTAPGMLTGSNLTFSGSGAVTVTAHQAGSALWNPADDVQQVLNVSKVEQEPILFQPPASMSYLSSNQLTVTGGSGTGLVVFSVLSGPGELSGDYLSITNSTGTIRLEATKKTDAMYLASVTNASVEATRAQQHIDFSLTTVTVGTTNTLNATASSGLPVSYTLLSTNAVLIATNQLYCPAVGQVDLRLSVESNNFYYATVSTNQIQVREPAKGLSFLQLLFE